MLCAQKIIGLAAARGVNDISNLKLQKLVYYSQAWHLALFGTVLFPDPIEAWVHGPVIRGVFTKYKYGNLEPARFDLAADSHLVDVFDAYGNFAGSQLERMTHSEKPWIEARAGLAADAPSKNVIRVDTMREFYGALSCA
jgi:uncharacterized phage-associated protein